MSKPVLLICSVELEMAPLRARMEAAERVADLSVPAWSGRMGGREMLAVIGGMGKANAAHALTVALERRATAGVIGFGVGGAYPGSGLDAGHVAVATEENYGDEGVATPDGWISCEGIGIPLLAGAGALFHNRFPVHGPSLPGVLARLREAAVPAADGPFVTVSCCSGTWARGDELARRFGGVCESMEGAAYAHLAAIYRVPFLELRGISNLVEDRDLARWRLAEAADRAAEAVAIVASTWTPEPLPQETLTR